MSEPEIYRQRYTANTPVARGVSELIEKYGGRRVLEAVADYCYQHLRLRCFGAGFGRAGEQARPARGAWIETRTWRLGPTQILSLAPRGAAWIEQFAGLTRPVRYASKRIHLFSFIWSGHNTPLVQVL